MTDPTHNGAPHRPPPLPGPLGRMCAAVYGAVVARRNRRFDLRQGVVRFDRPVISVGNLSVGGTGKTPMVQHLLRVLRDSGRRPCVAMRGYRPGGGHGAGSDEAMEYKREFPGMPIVAQPDRVAGLLDLFATPEGESVDCIVLDDGFQHRRIARDFDIVLIDATRNPFEDRLLPAGWLREPVESLRRAHAVVVTHVESVTRTAAIAIETRVWDLLRGGVTAACRHDWTGFISATRMGEEVFPVNALSGKRVYAACAIGNPDPFLAQAARAAGRELVGSAVLRDHDEYAGATVRRIVDDLARLNADAIIVTEKDWSKLFKVGVDAWPCRVFRPVLELTFDRGGDQLRHAMLERVGSFQPSDD